ncbi:MAG: ABC transporter ATP-binding protein [Pyrinomonadaceae bacterium]|nr:ABC transporter ATP-binding protein [Pyrinomonadaceae bacterium]
MKAIEVNELAKRYWLQGRVWPTTIRDFLLQYMPFRKSVNTEEKRILWALDDITFSVEEGESVALIGNNGAGKSTLLKILSRIVKPTRGSAVLRGRTGSLLEVGTGFHRELSGRENVYLNGAVLGMRRSEIKDRFDEIVEFSEIERFLDTPIKFYSSGMFMRLAFAVAAHLEPEILMVDEVLAVGDLAFQRKCLRKMRDIGEQGRTVIFVSHNMQAVTRLCDRALWIEDGRIREDGQTKEVVSNYLNSRTETSSFKEWDTGSAPRSDGVRLLRAKAADERDNGTAAFDIRKSICLECQYEVLRDGEVFSPAFQLTNEENICVFTSFDSHSVWRKKPREKGVYTSRVTIPANTLSEGNFRVNVICATAEPYRLHFEARDAISFLVADTVDGDSARGDFGGHIEGVVRPMLDWETTVDGLSR